MPGLAAWGKWNELTLSLGYTGGLLNDEPTSSLGGTLSFYPVHFQSASLGWLSFDFSMNNIFDNISQSERTSGYQEHRGLYFGNFNGGNARVPVYNASIEIEWHGKPTGCSFYWGTDSLGVRTTSEEHMLEDHPDWQNYPATMSSISNETASPSVTSWKSSSITVSELEIGSWIPIWMKLSISAGASAYRDAHIIFHFQGEATE